MPPKRTVVDVERIVELMLNGVPYRRVAAEVGCSTTTVQKHWFRYLDTRNAERAEQTERERARVLARLERTADTAWREYEAAIERAAEDEHGGPALRSAAERFMARAMAADKEYARLAGLDRPERLELTGRDGGPIEVSVNPVDLLKARLAAMNPAQSQTADGDL